MEPTTTTTTAAAATTPARSALGLRHCRSADRDTRERTLNNNNINMADVPNGMIVALRVCDFDSIAHRFLETTVYFFIKNIPIGLPHGNAAEPRGN